MIPQILRLALYSLFLLCAASPHGQEIKPSANSTSSSALQQATSLYRNGKLKQAINEYEEIIRSGSDSALAYAGLARAYLKEGNVPEAHAAASKALELAPAISASRVALGEVYYREGRFEESEQEFLDALDENREDARAYFGLSRLYHAGFDQKRWKVAVEMAHSLDSNDPESTRDWVETRPTDEKIRFLEALIASPGYGDRILRAESRHTLAIMKDQELHPDRTCRIVGKPEARGINLERWLRPDASGDVQHPVLYHGMGLNVRLNSHNFHLLLATGGAGIILSEEAARKAGVLQIARVDVEGLGDKNPPEGYVGFVERTEVGKLELRNCYVTVAQDTVRDSFLKDIDGAIGVGMFSSFLVEIDLPDAKLKLNALPPRPSGSAEQGKFANASLERLAFHERYAPTLMKNWSPIYQFGEDLVISAEINGTGPRLFVIATGATDSLISTGTARSAMVSTTNEEIPARGLNGEIERVLKTGAVRLRFAHFTTRTSLALVDLSSQSQTFGVELSGILGFDLLGNMDVKIDLRDGFVNF